MGSNRYNRTITSLKLVSNVSVYKMAANKRISNQERYFFHNNLAILLKAVEGRVTTVDFRNEASITGLVEQVDGLVSQFIHQYSSSVRDQKPT